jgi:hypothetical protein
MATMTIVIKRLRENNAVEKTMKQHSFWKGRTVGISVGAGDGAGVGIFEGFGVGALVGLLVGFGVGFEVGLKVGEGEGAT